MRKNKDGKWVVSGNIEVECPVGTCRYEGGMGKCWHHSKHKRVQDCGAILGECKPGSDCPTCVPTSPPHK